MKTLTTKKGISFFVDDPDYSIISGIVWFVDSGGYVRGYEGKGRKNRRLVLLARFLMKPESGLVVDHIDHNPLNNQRANLRVCTQAENRLNSRRRKGTSSRYRGVTFIKGRKLTRPWNASVTLGLGSFETEEAAARAYDKWVKANRGAFSVLNFPEESEGGLSSV